MGKKSENNIPQKREKKDVVQKNMGGKRVKTKIKREVQDTLLLKENCEQNLKKGGRKEGSEKSALKTRNLKPWTRLTKKIEENFGGRYLSI